MLGFIVNPVSGNGKGKTVWEHLERALRGQGAHFIMRQTSGEGEAQKLAIELIQKEGVKKLIAVGGDGTVHEVINGIQKSGQNCVFGHVAVNSIGGRAILLRSPCLYQGRKIVICPCGWRIGRGDTCRRRGASGKTSYLWINGSFRKHRQTKEALDAERGRYREYKQRKKTCSPEKEEKTSLTGKIV